MPRIAFSHLPDGARMWIFAADRRLSDAERERLLEATDGFLDLWAAHGVPLHAGREVRMDQFLIIGVDEQAAGVSGCSIDALVRSLKDLERELSIKLVDNTPVLYRDGDTICRVSRARFQELVGQGAVSLDTPVFNNTLARVGDLRAGRWEVPASGSWHARAFFETARTARGAPQ